MHSTETMPVLADPADVLSDQLRLHLERLAVVLTTARARAGHPVSRAPGKVRYHARQIKALCDITPDAAARILVGGGVPHDFFELVEYSGRRLAMLNVPPASVLHALRRYDRVLDPVLVLSYPDEYKNLRWARASRCNFASS